MERMERKRERKGARAIGKDIEERDERRREE